MSFAKSGSECSAMHLWLGLWPSLCTCRRAKQGRAGRHAHSWKQQLSPGRGSTVTVQGTVFMQVPSAVQLTRRVPLRDGPRRLNQMARQQAAVLLAGGPWASGHAQDTNCHRGSISPDSFQKKDYAQELELETWVLSGLPKEERTNKIHIWAAQCRCSEVPMKEQHIKWMQEHVTDSNTCSAYSSVEMSHSRIRWFGGVTAFLFVNMESWYCQAKLWFSRHKNVLAVLYVKQLRLKVYK